MRITVKPADRLFDELGNNTYDYKDLLSELIDNSVAARMPGEVLHVKIQIAVDGDMRPVTFVISDDGSGIPEERIGAAITPAGLQTQGSLNEHGLGMKQAVAALGRLESLVTKTSDRQQAIRVPEFKFGDIEADEIALDRAHGTTITVGDLKPLVVTNPTSYTRSVIPYLGARYRRFLRPDNATLTLLSTQGLDLIFHDRIILFHQLSELGIVNQQHPDFNAIRGEISLLNGFSTAITKNSMIHDDHFRECIDLIRDILTGEKPGPGGRKENYVQHKGYPEELPEDLLRDRLSEWLTNNPLQRRQHVAKEYVVEGVEGFIDILADAEAWELKKEQASALDVYQLFMYMDIGDIRKGYLLAKTFTPGANIAARAVLDKHQKEITLAPLNQFPINHPPNAQEREDYY